MPNDRRTSPSGTVALSSGQRRRRSSRDSTPPRLVAWVHTRTDGAERRRRRLPRRRRRSRRWCRSRGSAPGRRPDARRVGGRARSRSPAPARRAAPACGARAGPGSSRRRWAPRRAAPGGCAGCSASVGVAGDEGAHQQVGVAAERLGHAVQDEVGAEVERRLEDRRGEGVVDEDQGAGRVRRRDAGRQVGDLEQRVRRGLQPQQVRARAGGGHRRGVVGLDDAQADASDGGELAQAHRHAGVGRARRDDDGARRDEVHDGVGGRHARGERDGRAVLERTDAPARGPTVVGAASRAYSIEPPAWKDGGGHDRACSAAGPGSTGRPAGADGDGLDGQGPRRVGRRRRIGRGLGHRPTLAAARARAGYGRAVNRIRVAVLLGGRSSEHAISCISGRSIVAALDPQRYDVTVVGIARDGAGCGDPDGGLGILRQDGPLPGDRGRGAGRRPRRLPRRRRRLPGAARAVGRGRHRPGAARDAGRALRRVGGARRRRSRWTRAS